MTGKDSHVYRVGRVPRTLMALGEVLEPRFGKLGREYQRVVFDKARLTADSTLEWVTPGHPLFEVVREDVIERVADDLRRGAVFLDLHSGTPYRLDVFVGSIQDGRGRTVNRRLFVIQTVSDGSLALRQPTLLLDLSPAGDGMAIPDESGLPSPGDVERALVDIALAPLLADVAQERSRELDVVSRHLEISLAELINRQNLQLAELVSRREAGVNVPGLEGNIVQAEAHLDELNNRLENRRAEMAKERQLAIGEIAHLGRAWVLPHPQRTSPGIAPMVRDEEIEKIAVAEAIRHEEARGWVVESVEQENRGFDLISRKPHPRDDRTFTDVRFIEVKGRAAVGEIALSANEYKTAERLRADYWLYAVFNCGSTPQLHVVRDPARLGWKPIVQVAHYHLGPENVLRGSEHPPGKGEA